VTAHNVWIGRLLQYLSSPGMARAAWTPPICSPDQPCVRKVTSLWKSRQLISEIASECASAVINDFARDCLA
jgi:hypothetical protein